MSVNIGFFSSGIFVFASTREPRHTSEAFLYMIEIMVAGRYGSGPEQSGGKGSSTLSASTIFRGIANALESGFLEETSAGKSGEAKRETSARERLRLRYASLVV